MPRLTPLRTSKKIVAVDFDGTLCKGKYPTCEMPNMKLINYIKRNRDRMVLILHTCREGQFLEFAVNYMKNEHGITFDFVNENPSWKIDEYGDCRKIGADVYINDASYTTERIGEIFD